MMLKARSDTAGSALPKVRMEESLGEEASGPVRLGLCAMEKKVGSKPMQKIVELMKHAGDIEIVRFPEKMILEAPVCDWPIVDVLISFFSDGFPLDKAEAYAELRKPHCINELPAQRILLDRRDVYTLLQQNAIPTPQAEVVERDPVTLELRGKAAEHFEECDDYIVIGDRKICKPFVEKPIDAEDHNVCIYYPSSAGGGVKRLFRKVGDRSSNFDPHSGEIRRDGTYMYEPFMKTRGTDIKVYTVGPGYAHAEARKSPALDGVVNRNQDGKEVRTPVVLTPQEKEYAARISEAFRQYVCGFDLLRTSAGSLVIDVNGWSFVKGMQKYYEDAAQILRLHVLEKAGRSPRYHRPSCVSNSGVQSRSTHLEEEDEEEPADELRTDRWQHEELLAVLAVVRHGDRTPKNKLKLTTTRKEFLDLHKAWASGPKKEAKLKTPTQLQQCLDLTYVLLGEEQPRSPKAGAKGARSPPKQPQMGASPTNSAGLRRPYAPKAPPAQPQPPRQSLPAACLSWLPCSPLASAGSSKASSSEKKKLTAPDEQEEKFKKGVKHIRNVLEDGGKFDGIYRKVQLKPTSWASDGSVSELCVVLKYGGILTDVGVSQAEDLGHKFRAEMYPDERAEGVSKRDTGLLRLHATQRHDFKVYSSDEGRVQMSAAAFTRGLLDLERGELLTPICAALVETDSLMLDDLPSEAQPLLESAKRKMQERITGNSDAEKGEGKPDVTPLGPRSASASMFATAYREGSLDLPALEDVDGCGTASGIPRMTGDLAKLLECIRAVCQQLDHVEPGKVGPVTHLERVQMRWSKLAEELWDKKKKQWNISKVPEIHDAVKYDLIHHPDLALGLGPLHVVSNRLNNVIVSNEYGSDTLSRLRIGSAVCGRLLRKLIVDMTNSVTQKTGFEEHPLPPLTTASQYLKEHYPNEGGPPEEESEDEDEDADDDDDAAELEEDEFARRDRSRHHGADSCKTSDRLVRTRLYFTSESHIQSLMNVLRLCHALKPAPDATPNRSSTTEAMFGRTNSFGEEAMEPSPSDYGQRSSLMTHQVSGVQRRRADSITWEGWQQMQQASVDQTRIVAMGTEQRLQEDPAFSYLTQVVFRLYEDKRALPSSPDRYKVEVLFSSGANGDPADEAARDDRRLVPIQELFPLHSEDQPLTFARIKELLGPFSSREKDLKAAKPKP